MVATNPLTIARRKGREEERRYWKVVVQNRDETILRLREALEKIAKCEFSVTQMQKNMEIAKKALEGK